MKNDSFIAEKYYDDLYERSENASLKECPKCSGSGFEYYSDCCGAIVNHGICQDCEKPCSEIKEKCETCDGEGKDERLS